MKTAGNLTTLRLSLAYAGLSVCDPISRWDISPDDELETYDQDGSLIYKKQMDGNAVARLLIPAGVDPHRSFSLSLESNPRWVAAEQVEEWRALAWHVHLGEVLPSAQLAESRAKVRF